VIHHIHHQHHQDKEHRMSDKHKAVSFSLGRVVATPGALAALEKVGKAPIDYLQRHAKGDWGEALCEEDKQTNAQALKHGTRLLSAYLLPDETKIWIITDGVINPDTGERYATTLLLPEEY
jgi:hypothetical protein